MIALARAGSRLNRQNQLTCRPGECASPHVLTPFHTRLRNPSMDSDAARPNTVPRELAQGQGVSNFYTTVHHTVSTRTCGGVCGPRRAATDQHSRRQEPFYSAHCRPCASPRLLYRPYPTAFSQAWFQGASHQRLECWRRRRSWPRRSKATRRNWQSPRECPRARGESGSSQKWAACP